jgi:hypothetical protein
LTVRQIPLIPEEHERDVPLDGGGTPIQKRSRRSACVSYRRQLPPLWNHARITERVHATFQPRQGPIFEMHNGRHGFILCVSDVRGDVPPEHQAAPVSLLQ